MNPVSILEDNGEEEGDEEDEDDDIREQLEEQADKIEELLIESKDYKMQISISRID